MRTSFAHLFRTITALVAINLLVGVGALRAESRQDKRRGTIESYGRVLRDNPRDGFARCGRAGLYYGLGNYALAIADYSTVIACNGDPMAMAQAYNGLAIVWSGSVTAYRDPRAMNYAYLACVQTRWANGDYVETLAQAYAAFGYYDYAVTVERLCLGMRFSGERLVEVNRRIGLYGHRMAYRGR